MNSDEAYQTGLVDQPHEPDLLLDVTEQYLETLCNGARGSAIGAKIMVDAIVTGLAAERIGPRRMRLEPSLGENQREGTQTFLEKRRPVFH